MDWKLAYGIFRDVLLVVVMIYTWWGNREKVTAKRFTSLEKQVAERLSTQAHQMLDEEQKKVCEAHTRRTNQSEQDLRRIEGEIKHLPSQADIGRLHARIDEVFGLVKDLGGEMKGSRRQLDLVLEELLRRDK